MLVSKTKLIQKQQQKVKVNAMKKVNKTLINNTSSGDIVCFGGKTYIIGHKDGTGKVELATVGVDQKINGPFETYELI